MYRGSCCKLVKICAIKTCCYYWKMANVRLKECDLFELAHVLRVRPISQENEQGNKPQVNQPYIVLCDWYDDSERSLLVLLCRNGKDNKETLLIRHHQLYHKAILKEVPWFQSPLQSIQCISLDPTGTWLLCACKDRNLYLVPVLALVVGAEEVDCPPHWRSNDLTKFPSTNRQGVVTCIVWWEQCLVNTHICILGTQSGEIVFVDLHKCGQTVFETTLYSPVKHLNIIQDKVHGTSYLLVQTLDGRTWKLLLESYSTQRIGERSLSPESDVSLLTNEGLGYEVLNRRSAPLHSLIVAQQDNRAMQLEQVNCQVENEVVQLSVQYARNQYFLCIINYDTKICQIYDVEQERVPMFIYDLGETTKKILLTDRLLFTVAGKKNKNHVNILSSQMAETGSSESPRKNKGKPCSNVQTFVLPEEEHVLSMYRYSTYTILENNRKTGCDQSQLVDGCVVITTAGVYEIRPRVSPEELFLDLAVNNVDTTAADRLAIITGLDVNTLYEQAGDIAMEAGQLRHALDLYQASKCSHSLRVRKFSKYASVKDVIVYIQEILHQPGDISSAERKQLANMVIKCFVQEVLENDSDITAKLKDDFCQFINDNFDYDEYGALELLANFSLQEYLFQVAKARGLMNEALDILASKGHFNISQESQTFLISKGFSDVLCKNSDGAFLRCMPPENAIHLILAKPEAILPHLQYVESLLPVLNENHLLRIAKLFDPSRPAAKTLFMKLTGARHRTFSVGSQNSLDSYLSFKDDSGGPGISDILQLFLSTLVILNAKRKFEKFPDMSLISEYCEDKTKSRELEESILRSGILPDHVTLSCGQQHSALVANDGDVYTWGRSCNGRLGHGDLIEEEGRSTPFRVELLRIQKIKVQSVSCGREHTLALTKQGVYSWGSSDYGQLGLGDNNKHTRPVFVTELADKDCIALTCGYYHSLALSADRNVWAWGWGVHGQLGFGNVEDYLLPARVTSLDRCGIIRLAAGYSHSAVLTSQGKVLTFGGGIFGQLGLGVIKKQSTPKLVDSISNEKVQLLCCGSFETMVVTLDQKFYKWGRNVQVMRYARDCFQRADQRTSGSKKEMTHFFLPIEIPLRLSSPIVMIRCGSNHAIFLTEKGDVYTMGQNDYGQLGIGNRVEKNSPVLVQDLLNHHIVSVAAGATHCVVVTNQGQTFVWGRSDSGQLGLETSKGKGVTFPTLLKTIPVHKMADTLSASSESLEDPRLNGPEFEKDLSDLSSIGDCTYSRESLATSLYQLWGYYNERYILRRCFEVADLFSASVIYKLQERWSVVLSYRLKSLAIWFKKRNDIDQSCEIENGEKQLEYLATEVITDVIGNMSSSCTDEYFPISQGIAATNEILRFWVETGLDQQKLEILLTSHLNFLACPLSLLVLRDRCLASKKHTNDSTALLSENNHLNIDFTAEFLFHLTEITVDQLRTQFCKRELFEKDLDTILPRRHRYSSVVSDQEGAVDLTNKHDIEMEARKISSEKLRREVLENFKRNMNFSNYISLSTTTTSTLIAASVAFHKEQLRKSSHTSSNVVLFTCDHNFTLHHFTEMILPEFEQRMNELPKRLPLLTQRLMTRYLDSQLQPLPTSCPACVYNFLRSEQLQNRTKEGKDPQIWEV